jgi:hypothetical protein
MKDNERRKTDIIIDDVRQQMARAETENPRRGNGPRCVRDYYLYDIVVLIMYMIRKPGLAQPKKAVNGSNPV